MSTTSSRRPSISRAVPAFLAALAIAAAVVATWPRQTSAADTDDAVESGPETESDTGADVDSDTDAAGAGVETVTVTRRDLIDELQLGGVVGYGQPMPLAIEGPAGGGGIVTAAPEAGQELRPGDAAVHIDDRPVMLAQGTQPLYRELRLVGASERDEANEKLGRQSGDDVTQLQTFLLGQGHDDDDRLEVDGEFGLSTQRAVKDWQRAIGRPATGRVDRSQLVFVDGPVRVDTAPVTGQPFDSLTVTSTESTVTVTATAKQRRFFTVGATVQIETDVDGEPVTTTGTVVEAQRTTDPATGSTAYEVRIEPGRSLVGAETATITAQNLVAGDALTIPVRALLALAEGGWAVNVQSAPGAALTLTGVELGEVVDGLAEITGLDEGTVVEIPR